VQAQSRSLITSTPNPRRQAWAIVRSRGASSEGAARERDELLSTKLTIPRVRPDCLARSHLIEALNDATTRELVLVCTPAGFGKTTRRGHRR
jgi:hypothetical protein